MGKAMVWGTHISGNLRIDSKPLVEDAEKWWNFRK
jgi:hypothetical protein